VNAERFEAAALSAVLCGSLSALLARKKITALAVEQSLASACALYRRIIGAAERSGWNWDRMLLALQEEDESSIHNSQRLGEDGKRL